MSKQREVVRLRRSQAELWDAVSEKIRLHETIINKSFGVLANDLLAQTRRTLAQEAGVNLGEYTFDPIKHEFRLKHPPAAQKTAP